MAEPFEALEELTVPVGTEGLFSVSIDGQLDLGTQATGTPTIVESVSSDLTISSVTVSTASLTINYDTVTVGRAIQFKAIGFVAGVRYKLVITYTTDSTPSAVRVGVVYINAKAT